MTEDLLQHVWRNHLYNSRIQLVSTDGQLISVLETGKQNRNEGPDFLHAKLRIGDTVWSGHIEIDLLSSSWTTHRHDKNPHYKNVILQVVWNNNAQQRKLPFPVLELKHSVSTTFLNQYKRFIERSDLPCSDSLSNMTSSLWHDWKKHLFEERIESKAYHFLEKVDACSGNWEQAFWELLAYYVGSTQNSLPFQEVARSLPVSILYKEKRSLLHIESLLLGQAGLLESPVDDYSRLLQEHYDHFCNKYQLFSVRTPLKYLRMRPSNFPDIRLSQLAHLLYHTNRIIDIFSNTAQWEKYCQNSSLEISPYWEKNYKLGSLSPSSHNVRMGKQLQQLIDINVRMTAMYAYAIQCKKPDLKAYVLEQFAAIPFEKNYITNFWQSCALNTSFGSAYDSQALLHLKKYYCDSKLCLQCAIGKELLL